MRGEMSRDRVPRGRFTTAAPLNMENDRLAYIFCTRKFNVPL